MRLSRTTLIAPIPGRSEALLVQPLTGQAAIVAEEDGRALERLTEGGPLPAALPEADLREAGFVVDSDAEDRALHARACGRAAAAAPHDLRRRAARGHAPPREVVGVTGGSPLA